VSKIAFFDFDGTITDRDTLLEIIKFQKGKASLYAGFLVNMPYLVGFKAKLISNQFAKEKVLKYFFGGTSVQAFQQKCDLFATEILPAYIRPGAIAEIKKLQSQGVEVAVVSASAENWIQKWAGEMGVKLIATQLEIVEEQLTGYLKGKNCHGEGKVIRIKAEYDLSKYDEIYCYGDSSGDTSMLKLATKAFYKPFRT